MDKPVIKDKTILAYVEEIENELKIFKESPYVNSYLALYGQIENWNQQLRDIKINLHGEATEKAFERAHKYFTEQKPYFEQLEYLRKLMTPEQQKELEEKMKTQKLGMAEQIALNGKK